MQLNFYLSIRKYSENNLRPRQGWYKTVLIISQLKTKNNIIAEINPFPRNFSCKEEDRKLYIISSFKAAVARTENIRSPCSALLV